MVIAARHARSLMAGALALTAVGCASTGYSDLTAIADQEPLPYSVLVTGGGFVDVPSAAETEDRMLDRTFAIESVQEPVPLTGVVEALRIGRVFTRVFADDARDPVVRARVAASRTGLAIEDAEIRALLTEAREAGHDFVVVVQRLVDGPVEDYGINDRWPLTVSLWFLVGLGMFIPDHTFESRATLQAAVYEVHTGRLVHRTAGGAGPVELALVSRGDLWSLVQSILIPPFWVASDEETVLEQMREVTSQRLLGALARQLKSAACRQDLAERSRAAIEFVRAGGRTIVHVRADDALGAAALRVDGRALDSVRSGEFSQGLIGSETALDGGEFEYETPLPSGIGGRFLQVLVRTVAGDVASVTVDLEER